jgi:hypothetical protein
MDSTKDNDAVSVDVISYQIVVRKLGDGLNAVFGSNDDGINERMLSNAFDAGILADRLTMSESENGIDNGNALEYAKPAVEFNKRLDRKVTVGLKIDVAKSGNDSVNDRDAANWCDGVNGEVARNG